MSDADLTPEMVLRAYTLGIFPMAHGRRGPIEWYSPDPRAVMPIEPEAFHISHSLQRTIRRGQYVVTMDGAFAQVIRACAEPRPGGGEWISPPIIDVYCRLHEMGVGHSVEAWDELSMNQAPRLVGGIYGIAIGGVFFGESMFHHATDASKVCLVHLVEHLRRRGFILFDVQFTNPFLEQFGVIEIAREEYLRRLAHALDMPVSW